MIDKLKSYGISENLLNDLQKFRDFYKVDEEVQDRIFEPTDFFFGVDVWEKCIYSLLNGQNLLLVGGKATGKNILSDNLSFDFCSTKWTISFHNYIDA